MSGLGQLMIVGTGSPAPSMTVGAAVLGGSVPVHVTTASGSSAALPQGGFRLFNVSVSGGIPPYTYRWSRQNVAGKIELIDADSKMAYIEWSGLIVGEYQSATARCRVTDSVGAVATSGTIVIGVQRDA